MTAIRSPAQCSTRLGIFIARGKVQRSCFIQPVVLCSCDIRAQATVCVSSDKHRHIATKVSCTKASRQIDFLVSGSPVGRSRQPAASCSSRRPRDAWKTAHNVETAIDKQNICYSHMQQTAEEKHCLEMRCGHLR